MISIASPSPPPPLPRCETASSSGLETPTLGLEKSGIDTPPSRDLHRPPPYSTIIVTITTITITITTITRHDNLLSLPPSFPLFPPIPRIDFYLTRGHLACVSRHRERKNEVSSSPFARKAEGRADLERRSGAIGDTTHLYRDEVCPDLSTAPAGWMD